MYDVVCYLEDVIDTLVRDRLVHIHTAETSLGEVSTTGSNTLRDVLDKFFERVFLNVNRIKTDIEESIWKMLTEEGNITSPPYIKKF